MWTKKLSYVDKRAELCGYEHWSVDKSVNRVEKSAELFGQSADLWGTDAELCG